MIFKPTQLFDGVQFHDDKAIRVVNGKVAEIVTYYHEPCIELDGVMVPGFIDTQVNGGGGALFNHETTLETLQKMVKAHAMFGTTSLLPTLITSDIAKLQEAAEIVSKAIKQEIPGIAGVHFEGPHLSIVKKGIHNSQHIRKITEDELKIYCRNDLGKVMVTVAPESISPAQISYLVEHEVIVCLGHSNAEYEDVVKCIEAGAIGFTHLFNAMSQLTSRDPNMVGAALSDDRCWTGIILDGHHVHPAVAKVAYRAKPKGKLILVTDAMSTIGSQQQAFHFDGHQISLAKDKLVSHTGQLAGSALDMISAVNNSRKMLNTSFAESINMASRYPAQLLGLATSIGQIAVGADANFVLLGQESNGEYHVKNTWIQGEQFY
jgi:N-acetylglucosamine-6-phosphate deacetylase